MVKSSSNIIEEPLQVCPDANTLVIFVEPHHILFLDAIVSWPSTIFRLLPSVWMQNYGASSSKLSGCTLAIFLKPHHIMANNVKLLEFSLTIIITKDIKLLQCGHSNFTVDVLRSPYIRHCRVFRLQNMQKNNVGNYKHYHK